MAAEQRTSPAEQRTSSGMWREDVEMLMCAHRGDAACTTHERRQRADAINVSVNLVESAQGLLGLLARASKQLEGARAAERAIERCTLDFLEILRVRACNTAHCTSISLKQR